MTLKPDTRAMDLDEAVAAVRDDAPPAAAVDEAGARVLAALRAAAAPQVVDAIRGCADVEALLPAHRAGTLAAARALLVEDHLHECAPCRARFRDPQAPRLAVLPWRPAAPPAARASRRSPRRYWAAAAAVLAVAAGGEAARRTLLAVPAGSRAAVQSLSGALHRVGSDDAAALKPGAELGEGDAVRTGAGAQAVLHLRDGSLLEMGERAELSVTARGQDTTVHLERGSIIVQAAKRRSGRLLVASKDCTVQVTGTVFSVNRGLKGSRVSVIEGQVRVHQAGQERRLDPGEQFATSEAMGRVPVQDEIAWSQDLNRHLALLAEVKVLRDKWVAMPSAPGLRHESALLPRLPANTVVFASVPNYGEALGEAHRLFEERLQESAVLREWWDEADPRRHGGPALDAVIARVRDVAEYLGDEVALAVLQDGRGRPVPLLLAEVKRPGLQEVLDRELAGLDPGARAHVHLLLRGDLAAVAGSAEALRALGAAEAGGLAATPFGERIAEAYRDGAGILFAADLERVVKGTLARGPRRDREAAVLHQAGFDGLRHVVIESKDVAGRGRSQALLTFAGPRRGVVSWLAAPAPMGSLEFLTPNAQVAAAFVSKRPALVLDDILAVLSADGPRARQNLAELEARLDLRLREDLAATLGGELAVALDGPLFPVPAWKVVAEVSDPARLQASLQVLVDKAAAEVAQRHGDRPQPRLVAEQSGSVTYYALLGLPLEVHYAYAAGYLVAGPSRAQVAQALRTRATGDTLGRSGRFRALLPTDGQDHVSGLVYQNLGSALGAVLGAVGGSVSEEQRGSLEAMARQASATLVCAYGREDGIRVASNTAITSFDPAELALPMLLERLLPGTRRRTGP